MAKETVNLTKIAYNKSQYTKVIDTQFTQLVFTPSTETVINTTPSIQTQIFNFFNQYQSLFFDIPKLGETNSHEYLIKTSQEYVEDELGNPLISALTEEIDQLREENNDLRQQIVELSNTQSTNIESIVSSLNNTNNGNN